MITKETLLDLGGKIKVTEDETFLCLELSKYIKVKKEEYEGFTGVEIKFTHNNQPFKFDFKAMFDDVENIYGCSKTSEVTYVIAKNTATAKLIKKFATNFHRDAQNIINGK